MRKWLPACLVLFAYALSLAVYQRLPGMVPVGLDRLLPFAEEQPDLVPRAAVALGLPTIALLLLLLLHEAPVSPLGRAAARLLGFGDTAGGRRPVEYHKFAGSYRLIVCWIVMLVLSMHLAVLSNALGWHGEPGTIVGIAFGLALMVIGNVMPRLRPNPVAGIRTARTMADPNLWARVHRMYGAFWVVAGIVVLVVAMTTPRFALIAGVLALLLSSLVAFTAPGLLPATIILAGLGVPIGTQSLPSSDRASLIVRATTGINIVRGRPTFADTVPPMTVRESSLEIASSGVVLPGTLMRRRFGCLLRPGNGDRLPPVASGRSEWDNFAGPPA